MGIGAETVAAAQLEKAEVVVIADGMTYKVGDNPKATIILKNSHFTLHMLHKQKPMSLSA